MFPIVLFGVFPPPPPPEGAHVLVVHFPIALLLAAPLLIVLDLFFPGSRGSVEIPGLSRLGARPMLPMGPSFALAAAVVLLLGTLGAFAAVTTGEVARDQVEDGPDEMFEVLDTHEQLGRATQTVFAVLTALYALYAIFGLWVEKFERPIARIAVGVVFLLCFAAAGVLLANTGHEGGRLVHEFGVKAKIAEAGK